MEIFILLDTYLQSMDVGDEGLKKIQTLVTHTLFGLHKEHLINHNEFGFGPAEYLQKKYKWINQPGIVLQHSTDQKIKICPTIVTEDAKV